MAPGEVLVVASGKYEGWRSTRRAKYDPHVLAATHPGYPNHPPAAQQTHPALRKRLSMLSWRLLKVWKFLD